MSQLVVMLQEPGARGRRSTTILGLLRGEEMEGFDRRRRRKRSLKERLGLKGMGCCSGPMWGNRSTIISVRDDDDEGDTEIHHQLPQQPPHQNSDPTSLSGPQPAFDPIDRALDPGCGVAEEQPAGSAMNLAAALAAERQFRAPSHEPERDDAAGGAGARPDLTGGPIQPGTPLRVSLMRLLEETDGGDGEDGADGGGGVGSDAVCCVYMGRKKGAAFIPCGHTYCRVCSRELWLNRGSCPLCNRPILEILDIF